MSLEIPAENQVISNTESMRKFFTVVLVVILMLPKSISQVIDNENFVVTHGPWIQNLTSSGITIIWTTNKPAVPGIHITDSEGKTRFIRNSHDGIVDGGDLLHKVRIEELKPGTTYKYSLNSVQILKYQAYKIYYGDTIRGKSLKFITPSLKSDKVTFTIFNDVHELSGKMATYLKNNNISEQDFYFFNGDMVNFLQETDQLFPGFIDTASTYFATSKPFYYIRGNHETRGFVARDLKRWFDYKDDSFYYSFDRGPVHFIVLDCGEDKPDNNRYYYSLADYDAYRLDELKWLKEEVKSEAFRNAKYRIVMVHMPIIREEKQNWAMKFLADNFGPVLQNSGIALMMSAHTHKNAYYEKEKSGFGYPVLVNSNNSFVEVQVDSQGIMAVVKDVTGKLISEYKLK
jgi:UDP-2,3-diacylglucosamine pyrophosphatase LpxH